MTGSGVGPNTPGVLALVGALGAGAGPLHPAASSAKEAPTASRAMTFLAAPACSRSQSSRRSRSSFPVIVVATVQPLHGVRIDVGGNRRAFSVADADRARVMQTAPDSGVVTVRARLRDAGVGAARLSDRRQRKRLASSELAEENRRTRAILTGMPGRVF